MLGGQVIVDIIICHQIIGNIGNQTVKIYNLSLEVHTNLWPEFWEWNFFTYLSLLLINYTFLWTQKLKNLIDGIWLVLQSFFSNCDKIR